MEGEISLLKLPFHIKCFFKVVSTTSMFTMSGIDVRWLGFARIVACSPAVLPGC